MIFDGHTYNVLIVSASEKFKENIVPLFPESAYYNVNYAGSIVKAKRAILEKNYDFILLNSPLPDDFGTRFAIDVCNNTYAVILMMVKKDMADDIYMKSFDQGVFTLALPSPSQLINNTIKNMTSTRERLRRFEKNKMSVEEKMEEIQIINRAKWILIEKNTMTENEAHKFIEKNAMDKCVPKRSIAEEIIRQNEK